jgi:hypothetical protein
MSTNQGALGTKPVTSMEVKERTTGNIVQEKVKQIENTNLIMCDVRCSY